MNDKAYVFCMLNIDIAYADVSLIRRTNKYLAAVIEVVFHECFY